jgi:alpha-L-fucosidase
MKFQLLLLCAFAFNGAYAQNEIVNGRFEDAAPGAWSVLTGRACPTNGQAHEGRQALQLFSGALVSQKLKVEPNTAYKITAYMKCSSGESEVRMQLKCGKSVFSEVASPSADWVAKSLTFQTGTDKNDYYVEFYKPRSDSEAMAWIDQVEMVRTGKAAPVVRRGIPRLMERTPMTDQGVTQQSNAKMQWLLDAKLGMFIHWGLYAGLAKGEWGMHNLAIPIDKYRELAYRESGDEQFTADSFNADRWVQVAKDAGMKYMCMVTQHHDGYALFHSRFPDIFSSYQRLNRDFVKEYVAACRKGGLRVGLYKTLINWRYPGYYDVRGDSCLPNKWGYTTAAWHKENARTMKNEIYCLTKEILSNYGKIDLLFWDGGWLGEQGSDADAAYFWEPAKYLDKTNEWPVDAQYTLTDSTSGRLLGLAGMMRTLQPDMLCNVRSGWMGDYDNEEGGGKISGPIRRGTIVEKCMTLHNAWGYTPAAEDAKQIVSLPGLKRMLADCLMRNMVLELNVGPDRHGKITDAEAGLLRDFGRWVNDISEAVYGTRGGPWEPEDNQFGFSYKGKMIYVYLLKDYQGGKSFVFPALDGGHKVRKVYDVRTCKPLKYKKNSDGSYTINDVPTTDEVNVIGVELNKNVYETK